jgi:NADP-dependent 3-hydroxy acid dehydrogenase YdfG
VILYNAFMAANKGIEEESWENIKRQFDVNIGGAFNILKSVIPLYEQLDMAKYFSPAEDLPLSLILTTWLLV